MVLNKSLLEYWEQAKQIFSARQERGEPEFPTGIRWLDEITDGIHRGEVWCIAGKSGGGKTSLALQIARNIADVPKHSVLFLSLEMSGWELVTRMFCEMMEVPFSCFLAGSLPEGYVEKEKVFRDFLVGIDFEIYEFGFQFNEILAIIQKAYQTKKPDVVFIDFVQLIDWKAYGDERNALMEYIRKCKELAKEYQIGIVVVSQLRRLPSSADYNRPPDIIDLKGSGSLEQTADKVILVYVEEKKNENTKRYYINLAKNRQGRTWQQEMEFRGEIYKFVDKDPEPGAGQQYIMD